MAQDLRLGALEAERATSSRSAAPPDQARRLYRVRDAMEVLGLSRSTIYEQMRMRRLRSVKVGRSRLIPADAITEFIELLKQEAEEVA